MRFYVELLGFDVERTLTVPDEAAATLLSIEPPVGLQAVYLSRGAFVLELMQFDRPGNPAWTERVMNEPGLTHLSLSVDDVAAAVARVADLGGQVVVDLPVAASSAIRMASWSSCCPWSTAAGSMPNGMPAADPALVGPAVGESYRPRGSPEAPLGDDVALDLAGAGVDRGAEREAQHVLDACRRIGAVGSRQLRRASGPTSSVELLGLAHERLGAEQLRHRPLGHGTRPSRPSTHARRWSSCATSRSVAAPAERARARRGRRCGPALVVGGLGRPRLGARRAGAAMCAAERRRVLVAAARQSSSLQPPSTSPMRQRSSTRRRCSR